VDQRLTRRRFVRDCAAIAAGGLALLTGCAARGTPTATVSAVATTPTGAALVAPRLTATASSGPASNLPPVLFLHGNGNESALWLSTIWRFESAGWPRDRLFAIDFPYPTARDDDSVAQSGRSGSAEQREQLGAAVREVLARTGAARVALIGSSRGGNAIRNLLKGGEAASLVSHAILCGTPNHGAYRREGDRNKFNGAGPFLQSLNAGGEVTPGVAFLTLRSDTNDLYAQAGGGGYEGPALAGATNIVLPGVDHNETATSPQAFAAILNFLTGGQATTVITPEATVTLNGRVTGFSAGQPTNFGVGGVAVTVFAIDPATGARRGAALHSRTTGADGVWGPFVTDSDTALELVVTAPEGPVRHFFRSPFPRSSPYVNLRLWPDSARADAGLIVFTRPRGYVATGRDTHLLDGAPVPGVPVGVPTKGSFRVPFPGLECAVAAALNGELLTVRSIPGAISYAEFHY
jgi:pimeloyl-ACP methyl ester carboxylesterase